MAVLGAAERLDKRRDLMASLPLGCSNNCTVRSMRGGERTSKKGQREAGPSIVKRDHV